MNKAIHLLLKGKSKIILLMFGLFKKKDPTAKMEKTYEAMLLEARNIQRSGDIKAYAAKMAEAEELWAEIEKMRADAK